MATPQASKPESLDPIALPPAAEPSSPLDNNANHPAVNPTFDSRREFYAPTQPATHSQTQLHQPLIPAQHNPFGSDTPDNASIAPSVATSQFPAYDATRSTTVPRTHHGNHRDEEAYLAALRAWAEEKQYVQLDKRGGLPGFYGNEELEERATRMKEQRRAEKEGKARLREERRGLKMEMNRERRGTVAEGEAGGRRRGSVVGFFRRQSTAV